MSNVDHQSSSVHWAEACALFYLVAPVLLFFALFVRWLVAVPALFLIVASTIRLGKRTDWVTIYRVAPKTVFVFATAAVWLWLAGSLGGLRQNADWVKHYALINYLAAHRWPALIHVDGLDGEWAVRYSLGFYLAPALILKHTSVHAQQMVTGLWSLVGIFLFFRILLELVPGKRATFIAPIVFIFFSGADIIGRAITHFQVHLIYHIEWWAGWAQYESNTTALFWAPQHAIPVWLGVAIVLMQFKRPSMLPHLALLFSAICFWSPFAAIGIAPYGLLLVWKRGAHAIAFNWFAILTISFIALPIALFLSSDAAQITHGFINTVANRCVWLDGPCFTWPSYLMFTILEFAVVTIVLIIPMQKYRSVLVTTLLCLLLIPLYKVGAYNDFSMRVSMPGLAVLAILAGELISSGPHIVAAIMTALLAFGAPTPIGEMARQFTDTPGVDTESNLQRSLNDHPEVLPQYFARLPISILRIPSADPAVSMRTPKND